MASRKRKVDLLEGILSSVTKLHSSVSKPGGASKRMRDAAWEEVPSPYLIAKLQQPPGVPQAPPGTMREVCRNPDCGRSEFEVDARRGDRICSYCGTVQNTRSIESQEEEHRTFADDDKSESKKRAEVTRGGPSGTRVTEKSFERAQQIVSAQGEGDDSMSAEERKRVEELQEKARRLGESIQLQRSVLDDANNLAERLVKQQIVHDKECKEGPSCRLRVKFRKVPAAAVIIKLALEMNNAPRQFSEFITYVEGIQEKLTMQELGRAWQVINDLLKYDKFPCSGEEPVLAKRAEQDLEGEAGGHIIKQRTSLIPRVRDQLKLPFFIETIATDIVTKWSLQGIKALTHQNVVACAIVHAYERIKAMFDEDLPPLTIEDVARAVELEPATIERGLKELPPPPPL